MSLYDNTDVAGKQKQEHATGMEYFALFSLNLSVYGQVILIFEQNIHTIQMIRTKTALLLLLCTIISHAHAQDISEQWVKENYIKQEIYISMRDGKQLFTAIYMPRTLSGNNPILIMRTPYSCSPYGEKNYSSNLWNSHWKEYVRNGYILVMQDVRGRWMSEGEFVNVRPYIPHKKEKDTDEASDAFDTVEWLLKNIPGNNGKVGVFGNSYCGFYTIMAALCNHPAIVAINPQAPATDWFIGDDFHHNGAFMVCDAFNFFKSIGQPRKKPTTQKTNVPSFYNTDIYAFFLRKGNINNLTTLLGDSIEFWNDMMNHPDYDEWWQARNPYRYCKEIKSAVLLTGGFYDAEDWYGTLTIAKALSERKQKDKLKIVFGAWWHGGWNSMDGNYIGDIRFGADKHALFYQQNIEIPFFNFYLKGEGSIDSLSHATIFFSGENQWKNFDCWPPRTVRTQKYYLHEQNLLSVEFPRSATSLTQYRSDPAHPVPYMNTFSKNRLKEYMTSDQRFASQRSDVVSFQSDILDSDLTLAGPVIANLKVSISTTDADFVVKIIDVFPEGFSYNNEKDGKGNNNNTFMSNYQMLVRGEIIRGRYRNNFEKPEPFTPDKVTSIKLELPDIAHTFKKGHRIMVQIQSSWFPLADRNPQQFIDIYHCKESDYIPADISIYHNMENTSFLELPILPTNLIPTK